MWPTTERFRATVVGNSATLRVLLQALMPFSPALLAGAVVVRTAARVRPPVRGRASTRGRAWAGSGSPSNSASASARCSGLHRQPAKMRFPPCLDHTSLYTHAPASVATTIATKAVTASLVSNAVENPTKNPQAIVGSRSPSTQ